MGAEQQMLWMCNMANIFDASSTPMLIQSDLIVDDEGALDLKTPASTLALDPALDPAPAPAPDQDQDQALRYA